MQLANRIVFFIASRNRAGSSKLVQVADDAAEINASAVGGWNRRVVVWVGVEDASHSIPLPVGVATRDSVVGTIDVKGFGTHIFDGCTQHAAISAGVLVHQIPERRQAQLICVFLNGTCGFVVVFGHGCSVGVASAQVPVSNLFERIGGRVAVTNLYTREKIAVAVESGCCRSGCPVPAVGEVITLLACPHQRVAKNAVCTRHIPRTWRYLPGVSHSVPNLLFCAHRQYAGSIFISTVGCSSDRRCPVTAIRPVITLFAFTCRITKYGLVTRDNTGGWSYCPVVRAALAEPDFPRSSW